MAHRETEGTATVFAIRQDERVVHIDEVPNGKRCGCVCPSCKGPLIAKQGKIMVHHFAHFGKSDCRGMTWLHRAAQEIVEREKRITLPDGTYGLVGGARALGDVQLEVGLRGMVIDCLCSVDDSDFAIEIRVTHEVGDDKQQKLINSRIDSVEIDLRHLKTMRPDWGTLTREVCDTPDNVRWIYSHEDSIGEATVREAERIKDTRIRAERRRIKEELSRRFTPHVREMLDFYSIEGFSDQYRVSVMQCWKCKAPIPVFDWWSKEEVDSLWREDPTGELKEAPGPNSNDEELYRERNATLNNHTPPEPKPDSLKYSKISATLEGPKNFWVNHCPRIECDAIQGGSYIESGIHEYMLYWLDLDRSWPSVLYKYFPSTGEPWHQLYLFFDVR